MPGGVRSRQPWLYLGADWAASDILGPEKEAEGGKEVMSKGRSVSGRAERGQRGKKNKEKREVMAGEVEEEK